MRFDTKGQGRFLPVSPGPVLQCPARAKLRPFHVLVIGAHLVLHEAVYEGADPLLGQALDVQGQGPFLECVEPLAGLQVCEGVRAGCDDDMRSWG